MTDTSVQASRKGRWQWLGDVLASGGLSLIFPRRPHVPTLRQLQAMLPNAAIETSGDGEITIWTGWAVDPSNPDGPLVDWCDKCESGAEVPEGGCWVCGRAGDSHD